VNGHFRAVIQKLNALHGKNAFAFALIAGNLFADSESSTAEDDQNVQDLLEGNITISLPIYFALGTQALPIPIVNKLQASDSGELCPNLYYLGKRTTTKTSDGIRIVALGGSLDPNTTTKSKDQYLPLYTENDAKTLKGMNQADILVTAQWPSEIRTGSNVSIGDHEELNSQPCIAELSAALRPRYHFSTSPVLFYEREPFFHAPKEDAPSEYYITRFLSLASYGNTSKQKWIYAFSIDPTSTPPLAVPAGTTASPLAFINRNRGSLPDQDTYRFSSGKHDSHQRPFKKHKRGAPPPTQGECFFCLSNPNLATHLITSIGTESYLTTAKGPLPTSSTYPFIKFPSHILLIPMAHSPTLSLIPDVDSRTSTRLEMDKYRSAIQNMLSTLSKDALGSVTWEISRASGFHTHWQLVPIPADIITRGLVEAAFKVEAENKSHPHLEKGDPDESVDYFRIWIHDPKTKKDISLHFALDAGFRDLQYARRVLAKLLGLEGRIMWQDCGQTVDDENKDVEEFKKAFKPFDFTEEEE